MFKFLSKKILYILFVFFLGYSFLANSNAISVKLQDNPNNNKKNPQSVKLQQPNIKQLKAVTY